ncbi:MAG TPA: indole-3-glycerol-phosphate synthase [Deltaproteobacteria bacterium]|nr:indole-3-glycerol-phosphate synthase [Deltaproteobacteria bacterium]
MDFLKRMYGLSKARAEGLTPSSCRPPMPVRPFRDVLSGMAIIAEVKYATPAEGDLGIKESPSELAAAYQCMGASAISCLTEPAFFSGSMGYLAEIRNACSLPILMKDFIVDTRQIMAGRELGADAFLLVTEMLEAGELADLFACGRELGMDCLVEIHGLEGLEKALSIGAGIIGVNCRDLTTLTVDPKRHEEMADRLPEGVRKVAESGISSSARLAELKRLGYDAALIGRAMARHDSRKELLPCG